MTGPRWREIEGVFNEVLDRPEGERENWLVQRCGSDAELLREVRSLLANDTGTGETIAVSVQQALTSLPESRAPRRAGPYELLEELGRGGMGTVYKARRADKAYEAVVAVKLVRPGMDTDFVLGRFRQERQTLAKLNHPNIARLLDGGTTDDGVPYIVMEYIDGGRINEYAKKKELTLEQKLRLFLPVCLATDHAHRNFVVHRDIKPGNILVDSAGTPKLLDFGICKLLHANPLDSELTMTEGLGAMTPDYASPEQVLGEAISPRSDVYSLGVVLYELLTGVRPHKFKRITLLSIEEAICHDAVTPPSQVTNGRLSRELKGDLDNILMRALEKEPQRRYESAAALAEDLRRYLDAEPVLARPTSRLYRAGKFIRRHRMLTAATLAVLLASTIGTVVSVRQMRRAESREKDIRSMARVFLYDVHDSISELPGATAARQKIIHTAVDYLNALAGSQPSDPDLLRELAAGYQRIGDLQGSDARANLGLSKESLASYAKAIAYWDQFMAKMPGDTNAPEQRLGALRRSGDLLVEIDGVRKALPTYAQAEEAARALLAKAPNDENRMSLVADLLTVNARRLREVGDSKASLAKSEEALEIGLRLLRNKPQDRERLTAVASAESAAGMAKARLGDLQGARTLYESSTARSASLVAADPENISAKRNLMLGYGHLGDVLGYPDLPNLGETAQAERVYAKVVALAREIQFTDPKDARGAQDAAIALMRWATVTPSLSDREARLKASLALVRERLEASPGNITMITYEAAIENQIAATLLAAGRAPEAVPHWRRTLEVVGPYLAKADQGHIRALLQSTVRLSLYEPAGELRVNGPARLARALALAEKVTAGAKGPDDISARALLPRAQGAHAYYYSRIGDAAQAADWRRKALDGWKELSTRKGFQRVYRDEMQEIEKWRP